MVRDPEGSSFLIPERRGRLEATPWDLQGERIWQYPCDDQTEPHSGLRGCPVFSSCPLLRDSSEQTRRLLSTSPFSQSAIGIGRIP